MINDRRLSNILIEGLNSITGQFYINIKAYLCFYKLKLRINNIFNKKRPYKIIKIKPHLTLKLNEVFLLNF